jgi:hypothetical protein
MRSRLGMSLVVLGLAGWGCGQKAGFYPVSGKVLYKGQPAAGAVVYFQTLGPGGGHTPMGVVASDGSFRLACDETNGAPAGQYNVLIEWRDDPSSSTTGRAQFSTAAVERAGSQTANAATKSGLSRVRPSDRLKGRYLDSARPLLTAKVEAGSNDLAAFELKD